MHTYKATVSREGKWWIIGVPELKGYVTTDGAVNVGDVTQARRKSEIHSQAVDFICTVTGAEPSDFVLAMMNT